MELRAKRIRQKNQRDLRKIDWLVSALCHGGIVEIANSPIVGSRDQKDNTGPLAGLMSRRVKALTHEMSCLNSGCVPECCCVFTLSARDRNYKASHRYGSRLCSITRQVLQQCKGVFRFSIPDVAL
jgi:hypothetical protein